ncbi:hypothetical protein MalM25_23030 [Planctomycetes bacterium MalM25]|nr:hypothetical protein MalM25_23030 [Planctomycetes bacterium MalM25]
MSLRLGCIADDYTGATDLGAMLARAGMRVLLVFGDPAEPLAPEGYDAAIIALKSRSIPPGDAVAQSLSALASLQAAGAQRFFFKYCSTFDSTPEGNIGPVAEALADELDVRRVAFCPAFPENGRTVYNGCLFVHGKPLNESGMEEHPLNPMTDANLVRWLGRQTEREVAILSYDALDDGAPTIGFDSFYVADALKDAHLKNLAAEIAKDRLSTGGSAIGYWLARALLQGDEREASVGLGEFDGRCAVLAGSCSTATQRQVAAMRAASPAMRVDPLALASGDQTVEMILAWAAAQPQDTPFMIHSTADPEGVALAHERLGRERACELIERTLGRVAAGLIDTGVRKLIVAGGETSGAVLRELRIDAVRIGPEIEPGVPWVASLGKPRLALALKSGNFGSDDFFSRALEQLA